MESTAGDGSEIERSENENYFTTKMVSGGVGRGHLTELTIGEMPENVFPRAEGK